MSRLVAQDEVDSLDAVIITAQRREQNLMDVPLSATSFIRVNLVKP